MNEKLPDTKLNNCYLINMIKDDKVVLRVRTIPSYQIILNDEEVTQEEFIEYLSKYER